MSLLVPVHNHVEGHAVTPVRCEIVDVLVVTIHVLARPLEQRFLCRQTLLGVIAFNDDFFNLKMKFNNLASYDKNTGGGNSS